VKVLLPLKSQKGLAVGDSKDEGTIKSNQRNGVFENRPRGENKNNLTE
jgi:hypothetical protein